MALRGLFAQHSVSRYKTILLLFFFFADATPFLGTSAEQYKKLGEKELGARRFWDPKQDMPNIFRSLYYMKYIGWQICIRSLVMLFHIRTILIFNLY